MPDVFLSYSREDQATARRFADRLQREGFSVWWDQALSAGQAFDRVTEKALAEASAVVVLWSGHSVDSNWVRAEAAQAQSNNRLVPVMIEPCKRPIMFELTHTADLAGWNGDADDARWRSFIGGLKEFTGAQGTTPVAARSTAVTSHGGRGGWITAAILALALVGGGLWWWMQSRQATSAQVAEVPAVAVLPFDDMSPDKDQGYLADGLAEEILNTLARIPGLKVFARNSSFEFRTRGESLKQFGETLGATHLLEGSLRKSGDQLRITAQLIDARTEVHVWSRTYDRPMQDVFKVQEDIAQEVAQTLQVSLGVGRVSQIPGGTRNVDALDAFLSGNRKVQSGTQEGVLRAIEDYKRAIALDPTFAGAWGRLAAAYGRAAQVMPDPPGASWQQRTVEAFGEARRLAPDAFFVVFSDIQLAMQAGDWKEADRLYKDMARKAKEQGVVVDEELVLVEFLWAVGRFREAIALLESERVRNPLDAGLSAVLGELYASQGDIQAALAEFDRGAALGGSTLARVTTNAIFTAMAGGDRDEVVRRLALQAAIPEARSVINSAMTPFIDNPDKALEELRRLNATTPNPRQVAAIANWAAYFGDPGLALSILGPQARDGSLNEIVRLWRPLVDDMRRLPEFKQLVKDLGLVDYWRESGWGQPCQPTPGGDDFECR